MKLIMAMKEHIVRPGKKGKVEEEEEFDTSIYL